MLSKDLITMMGGGGDLYPVTFNIFTELRLALYDTDGQFIQYVSNGVQALVPHDFFIEGLEVSTPYPNNNYIQAQAISVGLRVKECFYSEHDGYTYIRVPAYIIDYNASMQHTAFRSAETNIYWQNNTQNNIRLVIPAFSFDKTITPGSKISTNFDWFELSNYGENSITLTSNTLSNFRLSIKKGTQNQLPISIGSSTIDGTIVGKALDGLDIFKSLTARYDNPITLTIENT